MTIPNTPDELNRFVHANDEPDEVMVSWFHYYEQALKAIVELNKTSETIRNIQPVLGGHRAPKFKLQILDE